MKLLAAASLFCSAMLFASTAEAQQSTANPNQTSATSTASTAAPKPSGRFVTLAGIVAADRKSFLCDKDNRTWTISNPEILHGIEGQHATLRVRLDSIAHELLVTSAKLSRDERHAPRLDDAAFRK